jgi:hypothetical protein
MAAALTRLGSAAEPLIERWPAVAPVGPFEASCLYFPMYTWLGISGTGGASAAPPTTGTSPWSGAICSDRGLLDLPTVTSVSVVDS